MPRPTNPHVDFALPGWVTTPSTRHTCLSSLSYAYERDWNPRNLEYPWYDPWTQILQGLVADLPSLAVAPQSYLWYYPRPSPGDYHINPPSVQDGEDYYEEGNTLDSIASIHVGSHRNKYQLVDFAIIRKVSRNRSAPVRAPDGRFYLTRKMGYVGIPILCELKRSAPRTSDIHVSLKHSGRQLNKASEQLVRQAHHLFAMYPHQEEVLLIAAAGLWWSYRVLPRNEAKVATAAEMETAEHEEVDINPDEFEEPDGAQEPEDGQEPEGAQDGVIARDQDLSDSPTIYHGLENITFRDQISDNSLHLLMTEVDFRLRTTSWSPPVLFGTPPSNQVFYLIHQHLTSIVNDGFSGTKG